MSTGDALNTRAAVTLSVGLGMIRALEASGNVTAFESPILPLCIMAVALLIVAQVFLSNSGVDYTTRCENAKVG